MRSTSSETAMVTILALSWTTLGSAANARKLVLVDGGVSPAPVVIFKDAPPYTRRAADELAEYIEKTSGAKPNVIEFDTVWENWPTQAPQYYLMAQMTWNPKADGEAILKDYYRRGFGPAAGKIEAYWELLEETRNRKIREDLDYPTAYDEALFTRAYALAESAKKP